MRHLCRLTVLALAVALAFSVGCRRGGKERPTTRSAKPPTSAPKPGPPGAGVPTPIQPPKVEPGDIAGKARVVFGFYLEDGPLTPSVKWNSSEGRLTISHTHSSVNIGPKSNTRVAYPTIAVSSVRGTLASYLTTTVEKLPEVKVLELHVLFKGKEVGRLTATRQEMKDAIAAADADVKKPRTWQRRLDTMLKHLPGAWISPDLPD